MTGDLFSTGFAWGDDEGVATPATPVATRREAMPAAEKRGYPVESIGGVAGVAGVAETEGQRLERLLSQSNVAVTATDGATPETTHSCGFEGGDAACVASVASVAWDDGVAMLREHRPPVGADPAEWRRLVMDARKLNAHWGDDLRHLGWTAVEVFGVEPNPAHRRLDRLGLLAFISGGAVEAIDADSVVTLHAGKDRLVYQRKLRASGAVPIWQLASGASM
jgi:hypothetical protein